MYHLMMSEKQNSNYLSSGSLSIYRQTEVDHFTHLISALKACDSANNKGNSRFYILNESGQEYFDCAWID